MKRETKYIALLFGFFVIVVAAQLVAPKPLDWTPTFLASDKNPFGAYITSRMFDLFFGGKEVVTNNLTIYELADSIQPGENIISMSNGFNPDDAEVRLLFNKVDSGSHAFLSAYFFSGKFADTLNLSTRDGSYLALASGGNSDTTDLKFVIPNREKKGYYYRLDNVSFYFRGLDSLKANAYIISTNAWGKPVTIRVPWGKGYFILNSTPLAFTNNYLLYERNSEYASRTLSFLPKVKTWWTSYYQLGRLEAETPLRFILTTEPLRWAYYVVIGCLVLFFVFESKRKQRIIPIVRPLSNTTLEFVKTIGNMYLQARDHKGIAEKKIAFFLDQVRSRYYISSEAGDALIETLAKKSGNSLERTRALFSLIKIIQGTTEISEQMLLDLNEQIEIFTKQKM